MLTDSDTDEGCTIGLWETKDAACTFESGENYHEQIARLGGVLAEPPVRKVFEVSIQM